MNNSLSFNDRHLVQNITIQSDVVKIKVAKKISKEEDLVIEPTRQHLSDTINNQSINEFSHNSEKRS